MSLKPPGPFVVYISKIDELKETIKLLKKDNDDLRSDIGKLTLEKENLKFNLNQKKVCMLKVVEVKQNKRRNMGEALKGTYDGLCAKKKQLAET